MIPNGVMLDEILLTQLSKGDTGVFQQNHWKCFQHFYVKVITNKYVILEKSFNGDFHKPDEFCIRLDTGREEEFKFMINRRDKNKERLGFPLQYKKVDGNYEITKPYSYMGLVKPTFTILHKYYTIYPDGMVVIKVGYRWNGANFIKDTSNNIRASCVHDVYCQAMESLLLPMAYRSYSDKTYRNICIADGMFRIFAHTQFAALRVFGLVKYGH